MRWTKSGSGADATELYPDAVSVRDATGNLPLHYASNQASNVEFVRKLLNLYPESVGIVDHRERRLALHYAAQGRASIEVFELLLEMYPEGVNQTDRANLLPLHMACQSHGDARALGVIVRRLIELSPLSVLAKPLDESPYEMWGRGDNDTKQYILERQREAIQSRKVAFVEVFGSLPQWLPVLPDLVVSKIWSFAKPDLWDPRSFEEALDNDSDYGDY